MRFNKVGQLS